MGSAVGGIVGGFLGMSGAEDQADATQYAADTSAAAANYAANVQKQMYDQTRKDQTPWRDAGAGALGQLVSQQNDLTRPFTMADFQADPGYEFRRSEGMRGIQQMAAARGGLQSGNSLKALMEYGQNLASNEYGAAYNRFNNSQDVRRNYLQSLSGVGQSVSRGLGAAGQAYANNVGNIQMQNAANQGNAGLAGANARASGYSALGNGIGSAMSSPYGQNFLAGMMGTNSMIPSNYSMGTGTLGNAYAMGSGYQPLDYSSYNASGGFFDL